MRCKIVLVGEDGAAGTPSQDAVMVKWPSPDASGADVVVVADGASLGEVAAFVARSAPAAVVVATEASWCDELLRDTGLPRGRVIASDDVAAVLDAILADSGAELEVTVRHDGERGREGFRAGRVRVGAGGVLDVVG